MEKQIKEKVENSKFTVDEESQLLLDEDGFPIERSNNVIHVEFGK